VKKGFIVLIIASCVVLFGFTLSSFIRIFQYDLSVPREMQGQSTGYRIVLITREMDTPFWDKVEQGAAEAASRYGAELAVWGSYGTNQEDFLRNMEIAIASKVDGIIIQGMDTDEFNHLATVKAAANGIPIFTIANDVSFKNSLRRTYIGSDHYKAGRMIGEQLVKDMGPKGNVVLLVSDRKEDYLTKRTEGILDVLKRYPGIRPIVAAAGNTREKVISRTNDIMNKVPDIDAFVAVWAGHASAMVQEISKRAHLGQFYVYSFDDNSEITALLHEKKMNAIIEQSPVEMGELSVKLMVQWLTREAFPLDYEGYYTDIRLLKADDAA